jgi:hypothetical protein
MRAVWPAPCSASHRRLILGASKGVSSGRQTLAEQGAGPLGRD